MTEQFSLKDSCFYNPLERINYVPHIEQAFKKMACELRFYVGLYECGPKTIIVRSKKYCPNTGRVFLDREISKLGITSKVKFDCNGSVGDLEFDLDEIVDELICEETDYCNGEYDK
jgi:hypothetical protein